MPTSNPLPDRPPGTEPFPTAPPLTADDAEELLRLKRLVQRAEGFALAFARVNLPIRRQELTERLKTGLGTDVRVLEVTLTGPITDLTDVLAERLRAEAVAPDAVFVAGLEHALPSAQPHHAALRVLNLKRELLRERVPVPLVLWVPEYALRAIAEGAPDLWAWRSGVYDFSAPRQDVEQSWQRLESGGDELEYGRMTAAEKRERIGMLAGLLEEYEAREDADSESLLRTRQDMLNRLGRLHYSMGALTDALACFDDELRLSVQVEDARGEAVALHLIGVVHHDRGDLGAALDHYEQALRIHKEVGNRRGVAQALHMIGMVHRHRGDLEAALEHYEQSLRIVEEVGDPQGVAQALHSIGIVHHNRGDIGAALEHYEQSLRIKGEVGDRSGVARTLHQIGNVHYVRGDLDAALDHYERALRIDEQLGDRNGVANTSGQIGNIHHDRGDLDAALEHYGRSLRIKEEVGDRSGVATTLHNIGMVHHHRGDLEAALEHYGEALQITEEIGDRSGVARTLHQIGNVHYVRGDLDAALEHYEQSLRIKGEVGDRSGIAISSGQIARVLLQRQAYADALPWLLQALTLFLHIGSSTAGLAAQGLRDLRDRWDADAFDAAWQEQTGDDVPEWLTNPDAKPEPAEEQPEP